MCLAIFSKITALDGQTAIVDMFGVLRQVSLMLIEDARVGDYVIVHAGYAINKIDLMAVG